MKHGWTVSIALAGVGWWVIGLLAWLFGPSVVRVPALLVHLLGLGTVVLLGLLYGFFWWADFIRSKL